MKKKTLSSIRTEFLNEVKQLRNAASKPQAATKKKAVPSKMKPVNESYVQDSCPACGGDHESPETSCDYEECAECGFDHEYEHEEASEAHGGSLYEADKDPDMDDIDAGWDSPVTADSGADDERDELEDIDAGWDASPDAEDKSDEDILDVDVDSDDDDDDSDEDEDDEEEEEKSSAPGRKKADHGYSADLADIAEKLGLSSAGHAKTVMDIALKKVKYLIDDVSDENRRTLVANAVVKYVDHLDSSGELDAEEVDFMKSHPGMVADLDGFREFLGKMINKKIK
jgi:predicted RNA-binding Zn-ribbon protein involved in translation (DUF1610 family)